jgi:secreted trypsin-like serine protease
LFCLTGIDISGAGNNEWIVQMHLVRKGRDGNEAYRCGGSLINENMILTAAHCFFQEDGSPMNYDLSK